MDTLGTQFWHWSPQLYGVQTLCLQMTANQKKVSLNGGGKELKGLVSECWRNKRLHWGRIRDKNRIIYNYESHKTTLEGAKNKNTELKMSTIIPFSLIITC